MMEPKGTGIKERDMNINKEVINNIERFDARENILFAIFSIGRVIDLYKRFDEMISELNLELLNGIPNGYDILNDAYIYIKEKESYWDNNVPFLAKQINTKLDMCNNCMPDDEDYGGFETTIAQYTASSVRYALSYWLEKDNEYIKNISDALIEISGIIIFENYSNKYGDNVPDDEREKTIQSFYKKEIEIQLEMVKKISEGLSMQQMDFEIGMYKISSASFPV
jgi:hypothetical protein